MANIIYIINGESSFKKKNLKLPNKNNILFLFSPLRLEFFFNIYRYILKKKRENVCSRR